MLVHTVKDIQFFRQVLSSDGFTLDTTDFADILDDDEDVDFDKSKLLSNKEMLKYLNVDESDNCNSDNVEEQVVNFVGISFDDLKPRMHSIFGDGKVRIFLFNYLLLQL